MQSFQHVRIDVGARKVSVDENPINLTVVELDLLKALAENHGRLLSREQLLEKVYGGEYYGEILMVDVHLGHVRPPPAPVPKQPFPPFPHRYRGGR